MTDWIAAFFLVAGASLCLIAAVGVLRLPDFFMRMHAATKAGVAGAGLVLIGVAFAVPSVAMTIKVAVGVGFLLLTTPLAGHLLGRAGYVAGVPLWDGTQEDHLGRELQRGTFDQPVTPTSVASGSARNAIDRIVVALASGPRMSAAIDHAVALSKYHRVELIGLAIIDTKLLNNVGPVPVGGNHYASQLRNTLIGNARHALADVIQLFENAATTSEVKFSVQVSEGDPIDILGRLSWDSTPLIIGSEGWFDQGVLQERIDPVDRLLRSGIRPVITILEPIIAVRSVAFLHDGSKQSDRTLRWLLQMDPWPRAQLYLSGDRAASPETLLEAQRLAAERGKSVVCDEDLDVSVKISSCEVVVLGNELRAGWLKREMRHPDAPRRTSSAIVFG